MSGAARFQSSNVISTPATLEFFLQNCVDGSDLGERQVRAFDSSYGGDGITSFALPDLRSVTPNGMTHVICVAGVFPSRP